MTGQPKSAILCMDYQMGIISRYPEATNRVLDRAAQALVHARRRGHQVVYVTIQFRDGYPEINPNNKNFAGLKTTGHFVADKESSLVHPSVAPAAGDLLVHKKRVSAFAGSDLEMLLRAQEIRSLVLFGISTSGVVLSTLRQAADMDFACTVVEDLCFDPDEEVHRVLTQKVFPRQAEVISCQRFLDAW